MIYKINNIEYILIGNYLYKKDLVNRINHSIITNTDIIDVYSLESASNSEIPLINMSSINGQKIFNRAIDDGSIMRKEDIKDINTPLFKKNDLTNQFEKIKLNNFSKEIINVDDDVTISEIEYSEDMSSFKKGNYEYDIFILKRRLGADYESFINKLKETPDNSFLDPETRKVLISETKKDLIIKNFKIKEIFNHDENNINEYNNNNNNNNMSMNSKKTKFVLPRKGKVVVDCYADWCGPCKAMAPLFDKLSEEYKGINFVKCNIDDNQAFVEKHKITSIPSFMFFVDGVKKSVFVGSNKIGLIDAVKKF